MQNALFWPISVIFSVLKHQPLQRNMTFVIRTNYIYYYKPPTTFDIITVIEALIYYR